MEFFNFDLIDKQIEALSLMSPKQLVIYQTEQKIESILDELEKGRN